MLNDLKAASNDFSVTVSRCGKTAAVQLAEVKDGDSFAHTFETKLLDAPHQEHGMRGECSCLRHQQGILCDHLYSHLVAVGGYNVIDFLHERDTIE